MSFDAKKAYNYINKLSSEIGSRPSGSESEKRSAEWILSEFHQIGFEAQIEEFEAFTANVSSKKLEIIEPYKAEVFCEVQPLSGGTGPEGVVGELIYIDSYDEEYITEEITGKIIITSGQPTNRDKAYRRLKKYKPAGMLLVESTPRAMAKNLYGSPTFRKKYVDIPTLRISFEDGYDLIKKCAKKVRIVAMTEEKPITSQNVIAELPGSSHPDEIVVIGGHYDTVLKVTGAGDNAAGTAIVMELARVFKERQSKRTMRFVAWGCEEVGLLGSRAYSTKLREASEKAKKENEEALTDLDNHLLCVNLDVHGGLIGTNASNVLGPPELTAAVKLLSKEKGIVFKVNESVYSSDGTSLSAVGVPSVSFQRETPTNSLMHSLEDDMRWMSPSALETHGTFAYEFLRRYVADAAAWPFERTVPDKQKKDIEDYFKRAGRKLP